MMETDKTNADFQFDQHDTYEWYLKLGALSNVNRKHFKGKLPTWNDFVAHPNYDAFWKKQSLEPRLTKVTVPTLNVGGWYDQEDFRGPLQDLRAAREARHEEPELPCHRSVEPRRLARAGQQAGPHSLRLRHGAALPREGAGAFLRLLLEGQGHRASPEARMFQTGANRWESHDAWPPKNAKPRSLYLQPNGKLAFTRQPSLRRQFDEYISDPANPVPYRPRPVRPTYPGPEWPVWMVRGSALHSLPPGRAQLRDGAARKRTWWWPGR